MLKNRFPVRLTKLLGNVGLAKKCQLQAILDMATTSNVPFFLVGQMLQSVSKPFLVETPKTGDMGNSKLYQIEYNQ